jgi:hypothetical protein
LKDLSHKKSCLLEHISLDGGIQTPGEPEDDNAEDLSMTLDSVLFQPDSGRTLKITDEQAIRSVFSAQNLWNLDSKLIAIC